MVSRSLVAYYNPVEVERMYTEHISENVKIEETKEQKVSTGVYAWLMNVAGRVKGEDRNKKILEISDKTTKQAIDLVKEFIDNRNDIPQLSELPDTNSSIYKYSGKVVIDAEEFHDADENTIVEVTGDDDGTEFYGFTSFSNWVDGNSNSLLFRAADSDDSEYSVTALAVPMNNSPDERGYPLNFTIIYMGEN